MGGGDFLPHPEGENMSQFMNIRSVRFFTKVFEDSNTKFILSNLNTTIMLSVIHKSTGFLDRGICESSAILDYLKSRLSEEDFLEAQKFLFEHI